MKRRQRNSLRRSKRKRRLSAERLETRRVLAASVGWDGPGLGSAELTYTIGDVPESISRTDVEYAIETALSVWSDVVDITFTQTDQVGLRDSIDISFAEIDGPGGTLAQAYFPDDVNPARIAGDVQIDLAEIWEVGNDAGARAFDLVWVAAHEIGHSLGLNHAHEHDAVLSDSVSPNQAFVGLSNHDIEEIRELYAAVEVTEIGPSETGAPEIDSHEIPSAVNDNRSERFGERNRARSRAVPSLALAGRWRLVALGDSVELDGA